MGCNARHSPALIDADASALALGAVPSDRLRRNMDRPDHSARRAPQRGVGVSGLLVPKMGSSKIECGIVYLLEGNT
jgi:hypothetical protein